MDFSEIVNNIGEKKYEYHLGIQFLIANSININIISARRNYEDILFQYISNMPYKTEISFLKESIASLHKGLYLIERVELDSFEDIKQKLNEEHKDKRHLLVMNRPPLTDSEFEKWINDNSKNELENNEKMKKCAILVLQYEFIKAKIRIHRFEIQFIINEKTNNIEFVNHSTLPEQDTASNEILNTYKYAHIFTQPKAYHIFLAWHEKHKNDINKLTPYSFIFWSMHNDGLIHENYRPEMFRKWISQAPFEIKLKSYLKTLERCKSLKPSDYDELKNSVE